MNVDNKAGGEVTGRSHGEDPRRRRGPLRGGRGSRPDQRPERRLRKALNGKFPSLNKLHLVDYKVRVINSEAATAAGVRVVIESQDEDDVWGTVGVDENIIEASWIALVDSFEYKLWKDERSGQWLVTVGAQ